MKAVKKAFGLFRNPISAPRKDKWRKTDTKIGVMMVLVVIFTFGAYGSFTAPSFVCGLLFLAFQKYFHSNWQNPFCRGFSRILRIAGVLWLAFLIFAVFNIGKDRPGLYRLRKALYSAGNYPDSEHFDFLPEKIPKCSGYEAHFISPMVGQDAYGNVNIRFTTDSEGIDYLRSEAESRGGEHYDFPPDEALKDTEPYNKLGHYAKFAENPRVKSVDMNVRELYIFPETSSRHRSCYLLNAETGQVVLNW